MIPLQKIRAVLRETRRPQRRLQRRTPLGSSGELEFLEQRSLLTAQLGPAIAGHQMSHARTSFREEIQKSSQEENAHKQAKNQPAFQLPDYSGSWKILTEAFSKLTQILASINQQLKSLAMTASIPDVGNVNAPGKIKGNGDMVAKGKVNTPDGVSRFRTAVSLTSDGVFDGTAKIKLPGLPKETATLHGERLPPF